MKAVMPTMPQTASTRMRPAGVLVSALCALALSACQALPTPPQDPMHYDRGASTALPQQPAPAASVLRAVVLTDIQAPWQAEGSTTAMHYRLAYAQPHALHAYSLARWSLPPELLVQERLRQWLDHGKLVVLTAEGGRIPPTLQGQIAPTLLLALEDFHQVFDSPTTSHAQVRLRASLLTHSPAGEVLQGQQVWSVQLPSPSADAAGGAQALALAVDQLGQQLLDWLQAQAQPTPP